MKPRGLALCLVLFLAASAVAQKKNNNFSFLPGPKEGGGDITYELDPGGAIDAKREEYVIFNGGVTIHYQDIKLRSDKLSYNPKTRDVVAEGHVIIDQGPTRLTANQAIYNLDSKTGTFFNSSGTMDPSMYFSGDRIEKLDIDTYRLTNGVFTSCDLDQPAWSFRVGEAEVTLDDYARMKNLSFRARNLPVFWVPRLIWPTKRDRSQGFLIPRARFSDKFGARLQTAYFLPFGESVDATINADVSTSNYFGAGGEVRYVPSENVKIGNLRGYVVNNAERGGYEWRYHYQHAQENLPGGFRGVVDTQDYSDLNFFRQYDDDSRLLTASNIYSSAYLTRNRPTYSLNILADRRDIELTDRRQRSEQLPSLQLRMYPQQIAKTPFYFSMESSATRIRSGQVIGTERTIDADYFRTDVFPTVSMRVRTPAWFSVKPELSLRNTWYTASRNELTGAIDEDEAISRFYGQGQVELIGPSFSRVFNRAAGGFSRFKHVIEPRFRYVRTTDVNNQNRILRFDTVDSPFLPIVQDSVTYSLTQRILGKEATAGGNAREVLSFALEQSVALSDRFESAGPAAEDHRFTPLNARLRFNPYQAVTVDANATFGNVSHQLDQVSLSANLVGTGKRADKYLNFTYFASLEQPNLPNSDTSQIRLNAGSFIVPERIRADVQLNFDAKSGKFLEHRYLTGWTGSCYGVALGYRRYAIDRDYISSYDIAVTLKNVGTFGTN